MKYKNFKVGDHVKVTGCSCGSFPSDGKRKCMHNTVLQYVVQSDPGSMGVSNNKDYFNGNPKAEDSWCMPPEEYLEHVYSSFEF